MERSPEEWLEAAGEPVLAEKKRGILKVFLGYAPGVGKTYSMLSEALRRHRRGEDVVIGVIETHGRKAIADLSAQLNAVPRRKLEYKGTIFEEMDLDAILQRHPAVVLVDELAHTNIEGSRHHKRYEDVMELLKAKIDVLTTVNIQHIESLTPLVQSITGVEVRETVPDWVVQEATEVVMIDLTPEALQHRMERGDVYPVERIERALGHFFRRGNLIALRELALRQVAESVDRTLEPYLERAEIGGRAGIQERIAVCISSNPSARYLIARAARMARATHAELYALHVDTGSDMTEENRISLANNLRFAENLDAIVVHRSGESVAEAVAGFVQEKHITQVVFGRSAVGGWRRRFFASAIHRFLRDAPPVDVHIVAQEDR